MEPALGEYIVNTHTEQIKDIRERLHSFGNVFVKEQQVWDSVVKNLEQMKENVKSLTAELKDINSRLTVIEKHHIQNEAKLGLLKTLGRHSKWILIGIIIICAIFNEQISPIITNLKHKYLSVSS